MTTTPQRFTKRPVTIEAIQWDGTAQTLDDLTAWSRQHTLPGGIIPIPNADQDNRLIIHTLEGTMRGSLGDWVIKGVSGEFYACKPDIFTQTYEPAAEHHGEPNADEPTDAEVRAAASAMFDVADEQMRFPTKFDRAPEPLADTYRRMARAALVAARAVSGR